MGKVKQVAHTIPHSAFIIAVISSFCTGVVFQLITGEYPVFCIAMACLSFIFCVLMLRKHFHEYPAT